MIPFLCHSGKDETTGTESTPGAVGWEEDSSMQEDFGTD